MTMTVTARKEPGPHPEPDTVPDAPAVPAVRWAGVGLMDGVELDPVPNRPLLQLWLEGVPEQGTNAGSQVAQAATEFTQAEAVRLFTEKTRGLPELETCRNDSARLARARGDAAALAADVSRLEQEHQALLTGSGS